MHALPPTPTNHHSYNTLFKVLYISLTVGAIMGVRLLGTATGYEPQYDRFGHLLLCVPCAALAYVCNAYPSSLLEVRPQSKCLRPNTVLYYACCQMVAY